MTTKTKPHLRIEYDPTSLYFYVVMDERNRWLFRSTTRKEAEQFIKEHEHA